MYSLFRKFRENVSATGITKRYILYSIGEVLLIVIGILLALQIDNWNEHRKSIKQGKESIQKIYDDLANDVIKIQSIIDQLQEQYDAGIKILDVFENPDRSKWRDPRDFWYNFQILPWPIVTDRLENEYDGLLSKNMVNILRDDTLEKMLFEYYSFYDSRIENFKDLPQKVRTDIRRIDIRMQNSLIMKNPDDLHLLETPGAEEAMVIFTSRMLKHPESESLVKEIIITSYRNLQWFKPILESTKDIQKYIGDTYPIMTLN